MLSESNENLTVSPTLAYIDEDSEAEDYLKIYSQWGTAGNKFYPVPKTISKLPVGYYDIMYSREIERNVLKFKNVLVDEIVKLPDETFEEILSDIENFWNKSESYRKFKYVYKRGILLYGEPGCGKTSLINLITSDVLKNRNGIVINASNVEAVLAISDLVGAVRVIEKDRKIVLIFEDIDNLLLTDKGVTAELLNILDGNNKIDNLVIIATTNYPEVLEDRICNRPSRFDRRYEIKMPNDKIRQFYLESKMDPEDLKKINMQQWLKRTKGFSIDHLKELIVSVFILGYSLEESLSLLKNMNETKLKSISRRKSKISFTEDEDE